MKCLLVHLIAAVALFAADAQETDAGARQEASAKQGLLQSVPNFFIEMLQLNKFEERERQLQAKEDALEAKKATQEDALRTRKHALEAQYSDREKDQDLAARAREARIKDLEDKVIRREKAVQKREEAVEKRERDVEHHGFEVQQWYEHRQNEQRQKSSNAAAYSAAYHVQAGGMKGERFSKLVSSVQELSGLPADRFVDAQDGQQYPLVLLFLSAGGPRLVEVLRDDEARRCRAMVAPGGQLVLVPFRMGLNPQSAMAAPNGIDALVEFSYTADIGGTQPHVLNSRDASAMNEKSAATLKQLVTRLVPPPPVLGRAWLFEWLKRKFSGETITSPTEHGEL